MKTRPLVLLSAARAELQGPALRVAAPDQVSSWVEEIKQAWSRGGTHTMELARVMVAASNRLRYGEWSELWKSEQMPFAKRKGEMLVVIGDRLGWIDAQYIAHLPASWSVLYELARLDREVFEKLIKEGTIHPKLKLREAKELVAGFNGHSAKNTSRRTSVQRRLHRFREYVQRTLSDWQPEERELGKAELTRLLELIDARGPDRFARSLGDDRTGHRPDRRIFTTCRAKGLHSPQQLETTL